MNFPSISQFRNVVRLVRQRYDNRPIPNHLLRGTVKLHGTNAAVEIKGNEIIPRRRNGVLGPDEAHYGFRTWALERSELFREAFASFGNCIVYGEWAGLGIQKGVAIAELPKAFYVFAIRSGGEWVENTRNFESLLNENGIYNISQFPTFRCMVDFANPAESVNKMIELTSQVENECPVAAAFGVHGIGEGIVWKFDDMDFNSPSYWFKTKGEKHSPTKVKKLVEVDVEKLNSVSEFVDAVVTQTRLEQGLENIPSLDTKHTGLFLKWVANDVLKEESDRMEASSLEKSDITKMVSDRARKWFFAKIKEDLGL